MRTLIVITSMGHWVDWTSPLLNSLHDHEPYCSSIKVIDGLPFGDPLAPPGGHQIQHEHDSSLSQAINAGAREGWDWLLWLANDNVVEAPFLDALRILDPMTVYHRKFVTNDHLVWGDGGQMLVGAPLWEKIGPFDERLRGGSEFFDLDYTMRAMAAGGWVGRLNLPIRNRPETIRLDTERGRAAREFNRQLMSEQYHTDLTHMHG